VDWLTFISKIIEAVAWPVLAAGVVFCFRKELISLIRRAKSIEVAGTKSEFVDYATAMAYLESKAEQVASEPSEAKRLQMVEDIKSVTKQLRGIHPLSLAFLIEIGRGVSSDESWVEHGERIFDLQRLGLIRFMPSVDDASALTLETRAVLTEDGHRFMDEIGYTDHRRPPNDDDA